MLCTSPRVLILYRRHRADVLKKYMRMKKGVVKGVDAMKGMGAAEKGRSTIDVAPPPAAQFIRGQRKAGETRPGNSANPVSQSAGDTMQLLPSSTAIVSDPS